MGQVDPDGKPRPKLTLCAPFPSKDSAQAPPPAPLGAADPPAIAQADARAPLAPEEDGDKPPEESAANAGEPKGDSAPGAT